MTHEEIIIKLERLNASNRDETQKRMDEQAEKLLDLIFDELRSARIVPPGVEIPGDHNHKIGHKEV